MLPPNVSMASLKTARRAFLRDDHLKRWALTCHGNCRNDTSISGNARRDELVADHVPSGAGYFSGKCVFTSAQANMRKRHLAARPSTEIVRKHLNGDEATVTSIQMAHDMDLVFTRAYSNDL